MAAEPIYPDQLSYALDRLFSRVTGFVTAQTDAVMTQMRIDRQETKAEIEALRQETKAEIQTFRQETRAEIGAFRQETRAEIGAFRQETRAEIGAFRQETRTAIEEVKAEQREHSKRLSDIEAFQHAQMDAMKAIAQDLSKQMADGFAAVNERVNDLAQRVTKLEQKEAK